jgi:1,2-diacylglycerol 3-beta-glucosyltransferase
MIDRSLELPPEELTEDKIQSPIDWSVGVGYRRVKSALVLGGLWSSILGLHLVSWGASFVWGFTAILCLRAIKLVTVKPRSIPPLITPKTYPLISLAVAGKNEEAVIANLIEELCALDYPRDRYEVWAINDNSSDRTGAILDELAKKYYPQLQVVHRGAEATGGKSGALNQILGRMQGEIIGTFDADAQITTDCLHHAISYFQNPKTGAIQMRKAISNDRVNWLTQGQRAEMALDAYFQQQRVALGGIGELRGNGQFIRRTALNSCDGWNEETITDDLDLSIRLHLMGWEIDLMPYPPVQEEGVTTLKALWHQRNRWAEGGYQRYLDYWREIVNNRMGMSKTFDLLSFVLIQYLLPPAGVADLTLSIGLQQAPLLAPMTALLGITLPLWATWVGLRRTYQQSGQKVSLSILVNQTAIGLIFTLHWLVIMPFTTIRMAILPKRLKWVKTLRQGDLVNHPSS